MNRPYVTSTKWRELSNEKIVTLFDRFFDDVAIQPNAEIVAELRLLGAGTLELLEDRTGSSVYRIRDTGAVFQIEAENGECWSYDDYGDYQQDPPMDELVTCYVPEPRTYEVIDQVNGVVIVRRNKPPRFKARYTLVTGDIELFDKEDPFDAFSLAKYARQMTAVVSRFLKRRSGDCVNRLFYNIRCDHRGRGGERMDGNGGNEGKPGKRISCEFER